MASLGDDENVLKLDNGDDYTQSYDFIKTDKGVKYLRITFHCTDLLHFVSLFISWWNICYFHLLVFMNHVATDIQVCRFLYGHMVSSCGHTYLGHGIAGSHSGCNFLRNCNKTVFLSGCLRFQSHGQWTRCQLLHMLASTYRCLSFTSAILLRIKWCLIVALVCMTC